MQETISRTFTECASARARSTAAFGAPETGVAAAEEPEAATRGYAPYPAFFTAALIAAAVSGVPSYYTSMEFFSKLTTALSTPGTPFVVFWTRAEHAAHVMPVTSNVCFTLISLLLHYRRYQEKRFKRSMTSSTASSSPRRILSVTQVSRWSRRIIMDTRWIAFSAADS